MEVEDEGDVIIFGDDQGTITAEDKEFFEDEGLEGAEQEEALEGDGDSVGDGTHGFDETAEDAYEIRDEEDNGLEMTKDSGVAESKPDEKKDDNMLVVDEWDNDDVESVSDEEEIAAGDEGKILDPEESERLSLRMPALQAVMGDLLHLRRNRRLSVYPLTIDELNSPTVQAVLTGDKCEEVRMQFVRPSADIKSWTGFVTLTFVTSKAASKAVDELKAIKEGLTVKNDSNPDQSLENFLKDERKGQTWPTYWADKLIIVRGLSADTKSDDLRALFPSAEEIAVAKESPATSGPRPRRREPAGTPVAGYAYILFETTEEAKSVADAYATKPPEFKNKLLDVKLYREPFTAIPRSLLWLRRRKLVLKHLDHLIRIVEKSKKDSSSEVAPWAEKRIGICQSIIEKDNKAREELKLPCPTLEDFKQIRGLKPFKPEERERIFVALGIMERKKKPQDPKASPRKDRDKSPPGRKRLEKDERSKNKHQGRGRGGGFNRGGRRMSPPNRRRSDWSPGRSGHGFSGRNRGGPAGGLDSAALGLVNPLALLMQQGLMSGVNPAMLNQMMMNPASLAMMGGGGSGMLGGQGPVPFMGNMGGPSGRGLDIEPAPKMLRLDETGNFRPDRDFRGDRDIRGFDSHRDRDDRGPFHDRSRHRSRTPEFQRSQRGRGAGGVRGYEGGGGGGLRDSGNRPYGEPSNAGGPPREDDISLLMNLSKMLSQKMEQKRQQVEHGGYDRM